MIFKEKVITRLTFTCSNSAIETPEKGVKYVRSYQNKNTRTTSMMSFWCFLLLSLKTVYPFFLVYTFFIDFEQVSVTWVTRANRNSQRCIQNPVKHLK